MYEKLIQCKDWDEILNLSIQLMNENAQLKADKQSLIDENTELKLQVEQAERRANLAYQTLIIETGGKYR